MTQILYEVSLTVDAAIRDTFVNWLEKHIAEMTQIDGILSGAAFIDSENENLIVCHYTMRDKTAMTRYLDDPAKEMRADGITRFGKQFSASRRILTAM